ncbi:hypothetical protein MMC30_006043 [Trapelia coarctata]|nr:hypothetical protein [Trapelia coarctata]
MSDKDRYVLGRSYTAACRLNYQSYCWRDILGFYLHPSIPLKDGARIADVATGTGAWMLGLAREAPVQLRLDGMDISLAQAPLQHWLPSNVNLSTWNFFDEVPNDLVGRFDVVHVRLVLVVVQNDNAASVVRNLGKLLKPGGYLQWDELNYFEHRVLTISPSVQTDASKELHKFLHGSGKFDWTLQLDRLMTSNGFEDAVLHQYQDGPEHLTAMSDLLMATMEEVSAGLIKSGREEKGKWLRELIPRVYRESIDGAVISVPKLVCVGRKSVGVVQDEQHMDGSKVSGHIQEAQVNGHGGH